MIRQLNKIIEDYINEENTDYAIMINGKWGSGKSYYLYNEGKKNIKNKKYKPVIISLYGLSSIEDFYYRIFWGLCSFANRKVVSLISSAIERVAEHWNVSKLSAKELKKLIKISNSTILIFDDLERVSKNVSVIEILGLINLFSEIEHKKVIVVCNEEEIDGRFKDEYKKFKEKTFRYSYWYEKNIEDIFDELIKDNSSYNTFLRNERKTILDIFGCGGNNNLRTFHFIIETFEKIYNKEEQHKYKHKTEILQILLVSYVIYVCEYKGGASKEQLNLLGETSIINFFLEKPNVKDIGNNTNIHDKSEVEIRYKDYYDKMKKQPYVIEYIFSGYLNSDDLNSFCADIEKELDRTVQTPQIQLYIRLSNYHLIENEQVAKIDINNIISYVKADSYNVYELLHIYTLLLYYDFLGIFKTTNKIDDIFIRSISNQQNKHIYNHDFDLIALRWDSQETTNWIAYYKDKFLKIRKHATEVNLKAKNEKDKRIIDDFLIAVELNDSEKIQFLCNSKDRRIIIENLNWNTICSTFERCSNPFAFVLVDCITTMIENETELSKKSKENIKNDLIPWIKNYESKSDGRIRKRAFLKLKNCVEAILNNSIKS